ncbi:hypothetical protein [Mycolicibacterium madagascariense]|nr:hypothetical protein [Mycolicibacterium madagascariense]MCV7012425.1 hypothetical protein [Mycolicibacterium madagascariense]
MPARTPSRTTIIFATTSLIVAVIAVVAALAAHALYGGGATAERKVVQLTPAVAQPISQEGRIVAVSANSVTARSDDGFARTYVVDAQTNAITEHGSIIGSAGSAFAVNDEVSIVGVVQNGTAIATAVADKQVSDLNGPPMDGGDA